jgi:L,D-peptidoglycan transpeptidase YkuD (ErfK/YbiS/YcfS/YnhG family)
MSEATVFSDGRLVLAGVFYRAALGRGGVRADKQEGDGATPAGLLPLRRVLYRADKVAIPRTALPREPIAASDGWCDDPGHPDYNRQVQLPHPARCEELWRRDALYDIVAVLGWNDAPVERGRGSAIFLHAARPGYAPTEGCVALALADLTAALAAGLTALRVIAP